MTKKPTYEELEQRVRELEREVCTLKDAEASTSEDRKITDAMTDGVIVFDPDYRVLSTNQAFSRMFGIKEKDIIGKTVMELPGIEKQKKDYLKTFLPLLKKVTEKGAAGPPLELITTTQEGKKIPVSIAGGTTGPEKGRPKLTVAVVRDISERKQAEEALRESEEKYRNLVTLSPDPIVIIQDDRHQLINRAFTDLFGYTQEDVDDGLNAFALVQDTDKENMKKRFEDRVAGKEVVPKNDLLDLVAKDGKTIPCETSATLIQYNGRPADLVILRDITERKALEKALQASEQRYRLLADNVVDNIWTLDVDTLEFTFCSPSVEKILGYMDREFLSTALGDTLTPESMAIAMGVLNDELSLEGEDGVDPARSRTLELEQIHKNGAKVWTEITATFLRDKDGKATEVLGVTRDISDRKKAEEALRQSQEQYRDLVETVNDIIWEVDIDGVYTYLSPRVQDILGYEPQELVGNKFTDQMPPEESKRVLNKFFELMAEPQPFGSFETTAMHKGGYPVILENSGKPFFGTDGKLLGYRGVDRNITKRKQAEKALQESESRYRLLAENVTDVIWTTDMDIKFTYISPSVTRLCGFSVDEAMVQTIEEVMTPASVEAAIAAFNEAMEEEKNEGKRELDKSYMLELELNCKDGSTVWTEIKVNFLHDSAGQATGLIGITRDISARKQAEEARRQTEEKYRLLVDNYNAPITVYDRDGVALMMNRAAAEGLGGKPEDFIGRGLQEYLKDEANLLLKRFQDVIDSGMGADFEDMIKLPSGKMWFWSNLQPIKDASGKVSAVQSISYDITERKRAEESLEKSEERLALALQATTDGIWDWDIFENKAYVSPPFRRMLGIREDVDFLVPFDAWTSRIHPDHYERIVHKLQEALDGKGPYNVDYLVRDETGEYRWHNTRGMVLFNEKGKAFRMVGSIRDIHDRMEKEEHIRALTQQLIKAQEFERQRISRELHDHVAQDLAASKMTCGLLLKSDRSLAEDVGQNISRISHMLDSAITAVRDLAYNLRPQDLEELGLIQSVFQYCTDFSEKSGLDVDFYFTGVDSLKLSFDAKINIFRLIQEGLNNVWKHADADHAVVRLVGAFPNIILRIEDNGKGFDVEKRMGRAMEEKRMGLRNMEERAILLQGQMNIHSKPEVGTIISIKFPYKENSDGAKEDHIDP